MIRRAAAALALAAAFGAVNAAAAFGHAGLTLAEPTAGAALGASPTAIRLTFSEQPAASLSSLRVVDTHGVAYQTGPPVPVTGSSLAIAAPIRRLPRGVYTVEWRIVSGVDGHATAGAYAFGVRMSPSAAAAASRTVQPVVSWLELAARGLLLVGLVVLLGAATATVARFGGPRDGRLAAAGWALSAAGVVLLEEAQQRSANTSFSGLLGTAVGRSLGWRALAVGVAGLGLMLVRHRNRWVRACGMPFAAAGAFAAIGVHVAAGHAAAGSWPVAITIAAQWAHFAAAGVWLGGLAALLVGVRGAVSSAKAASVRRFSAIAGGALLVVFATGIVRTFDELSTWSDIYSTSYGLVILVKIALLLGIAALGARNRRRSVPVAATDLAPLRRTSRFELGLAAAALAAAALLGTLSPPAAGQLVAPPSIDVAGVDFATTVRVHLTAPSTDPGPNRFTVRVVDYDSGALVRGRVQLRFTPPDDPSVAPTTLSLTQDRAGDYVGTGANLAFGGRWLVTVAFEQGIAATEVPLAVETSSPPQIVAAEHRPGLAPNYTVDVPGGQMRFTVSPEREGRSTVAVDWFDLIGDFREVGPAVITVRAGDRSTLQVLARRVTAGRFVARVVLASGRNTLSAVARTADGTRLRGTVEIVVS